MARQNITAHPNSRNHEHHSKIHDGWVTFVRGIQGCLPCIFSSVEAITTVVADNALIVGQSGNRVPQTNEAIHNVLRMGEIAAIDAVGALESIGRPLTPPASHPTIEACSDKTHAIIDSTFDAARDVALVIEGAYLKDKGHNDLIPAADKTIIQATNIVKDLAAVGVNMAEEFAVEVADGTAQARLEQTLYKATNTAEHMVATAVTEVAKDVSELAGGSKDAIQHSIADFVTDTKVKLDQVVHPGHIYTNKIDAARIPLSFSPSDRVIIPSSLSPCRLGDEDQYYSLDEQTGPNENIIDHVIGSLFNLWQ